jgi:hypothetical protein
MKPILWIAAVLMLPIAVLLIAGVGATGPWIAVIDVGAAPVVIDRRRTGPAPRH